MQITAQRRKIDGRESILGEGHPPGEQRILSLFNEVSIGAGRNLHAAEEAERWVWLRNSTGTWRSHQCERPVMCALGPGWNKSMCLGGNSPCSSKRPKEAPRSCLALGAACTVWVWSSWAWKGGDADTLKWFPKKRGRALRGLAEREWLLMVMILWALQPQRLHAFTRLKQQLEPVWGEHLFPFQIAS